MTCDLRPVFTRPVFTRPWGPRVGRGALGVLVVCALASLAGAPAFGDVPRLALVVGNSAYERTGWRLENPVRDADLVSAALREVGFEVTVVKDADKETFEDQVKAFGRALREAGPAATGLFYYSGHAVQSNGLNYLAPVDIEARTEADVWAEAPRLNLVLDYMNAAGNASNFVILDACRDNPLPAAARSVGGGGMARVPTTRGLLIAYATAPGLTATDGEGNASPFSTAFAELVRAPGLTAEQLFKRVADRVEAATDFAQTPLIENGLRGADFCFAGCDVAQRDPADLAYWNEVKDSTDELLVRSYLETFPNGAFTRLATARIEAIRRGDIAPEGTETGAPERTTQPQPGPVTTPPDSTGEEDARAQVRVIQRLLNAMGYNAGPADGAVGQRTRDAAADFRALTGTANTGFDQAFITALSDANTAGHTNPAAASSRASNGAAAPDRTPARTAPDLPTDPVERLLVSLEGRWVGTCEVLDLATQQWGTHTCSQTQRVVGPRTMSIDASGAAGQASGTYTFIGRNYTGSANSPGQGVSWTFTGQLTSLKGPYDGGQASWSEEMSLQFSNGLFMQTQTNSVLNGDMLELEVSSFIPGFMAGFVVTERTTYRRQ